MYSNKRSFLNVIYFNPRGTCKTYNTFKFFSLSIFVQVCLKVSWSTELVEANKFVMVVSWWKLEAGSDHAIKKIS